MGKVEASCADDISLLEPEVPKPHSYLSTISSHVIRGRSQYEIILSALLNVHLSRHMLAVQATRRIHYNDKAENIKNEALQISGASRAGSLFDRATDCHVKLTV